MGLYTWLAYISSEMFFSVSNSTVYRLQYALVYFNYFFNYIFYVILNVP